MTAEPEQHRTSPIDGSSPVPIWLDGKETITSKTYDVVSPSTGNHLWPACSADVPEAIQAVEQAQKAFKSWRKTRPSTIATILLAAADLFEARRDELISLAMQETGAGALIMNIQYSDNIALLRDLASRATNIHGLVPRLQDPNQSAIIYREPYGVIFGMAPWNAPYVLGTRAFVYALVAGNTAVLKGSELCPRTYHALVQVFHDAGLPAGVLNAFVTQTSDAAAVTNAIIEHPAVRKINFTGSTAVGSIISAKAGKELKPVIMELGGKASAIVCDDADLALAATQCALGAMLHAGQVCMSTERILVHESVLEEFTQQFRAAVDRVHPSGDAAPVLAMASGVQKNHALINDATSKGANIIHGSSTSTESLSKHQMRPVVLGNVNSSMKIYHEESFGPTVVIYSVRSDEEALELANDTDMGLVATVFTRDLARGLRLAREIEAGAVHINSMSIHDEAALPHGGAKSSGWGRFNGQWGVEEFLRWKSVSYVEDSFGTR